MQKYFEAEMQSLHQAATEFAERYPEQAARLNLKEYRDRDPNVERLLEGVAYLTAQVKQQLDADLPELTEPLLELFAPNILRPYPSTCIMEFAGRAGMLQQPQTVSKGAQIISPPVGEQATSCRFTMAYDLEVLPLQISNAQLVASNTGQQLQIEVTANQAASLAKLNLSQLKIYLHAEPSTANELYTSLTQQVEAVAVSTNENTTTAIGDQACIQAAYLSSEYSILANAYSQQGLAGIHDYFCCPERYRFITINNLDKIAFKENTFTINIELNPNEQINKTITASQFRLNCVPAINRYEFDAEPIYFNNSRSTYPLILDSNAPAAVQLYELLQLQSFNPQALKTQEITRFSKQLSTSNTTPCYQLHRTNLTTPSIMLASMPDSPQTLSPTVQVTNGQLPRQHLSEGAINTLGKGIPNSLVASNLTRPSQAYQAPAAEHWRQHYLAHVAMNLNTITEVNNLKNILHSYCWSQDNSAKQTIDAIETIKTETKNQITQGQWQRQITINLDFNTQEAPNPTFLQVLHQLFKAYAPLNTQLHLEIDNS